MHGPEETYRLRGGVRAEIHEEGVLLLLAHPLTLLRIDPAWKALFQTLAGGDACPFSLLTERAPCEKTEVRVFLHRLVCRGFLIPGGLPPLDYAASVSIIVPVRNRPSDIARCLDSLRQLLHPAERVQTLVVDDASEDATPEAVQVRGVSLLRTERRRGASFCRNLGARHADGEILAFVDSDCVVDPLWLRALLPFFEDPAVGAVGGAVDGAFEETGLDRYEKVRSSLYMGPWFQSSEEQGGFFYVPSCNFLIRRDLFAHLGGFSEDLHVGEDVDLCWRLQDAGFVLWYSPLGIVRHRHRNTLGAFSRRRFAYGTSEPMLQRRHPSRVKTFPLPPWALAFWGGPALAWVLRLPSLALVSLALPWAHALVKRRGLQGLEIAVGFPRLVLSLVRGYLAFLHHLSAFLSRYYLWAALPALFLFPWVGAALLTLHGAAALVAYGTRRPPLDFPRFLFYFSLEQVSYQLGVWTACLGSRFFRPVFPRLAWGLGRKAHRR